MTFDATSLALCSLVAALGSIGITIWRTRRSYNDTDLEELAEQVGRLARRARADTMRRVRAEKAAPGEDAPPGGDAPPELRPSSTPPPDARTLKQTLRVQMARDLTQGWKH